MNKTDWVTWIVLLLLCVMLGATIYVIIISIHV
jgi:hypothetical protein